MNHESEPSFFKKALVKISQLIHWLLTPLRRLFGKKNTTQAQQSPEVTAVTPLPSTLSMTVLPIEDLKLRARLNSAMMQLESFKNYTQERTMFSTAALNIILEMDSLEKRNKALANEPLSVAKIEEIEKAVAHILFSFTGLIKTQKQRMLFFFKKTRLLQEAANILPSHPRVEAIKIELIEISEGLEKDRKCNASFSPEVQDIGFMSRATQDFIDIINRDLEAVLDRLNKAAVAQEIRESALRPSLRKREASTALLKKAEIVWSDRFEYETLSAPNKSNHVANNALTSIIVAKSALAAVPKSPETHYSDSLVLRSGPLVTTDANRASLEILEDECLDKLGVNLKAWSCLEKTDYCFEYCGSEGGVYFQLNLEDLKELNFVRGEAVYFNNRVDPAGCQNCISYAYTPEGDKQPRIVTIVETNPGKHIGLTRICREGDTVTGGQVHIEEILAELKAVNLAHLANKDKLNQSLKQLKCLNVDVVDNMVSDYVFGETPNKPKL